MRISQIFRHMDDPDFYSSLQKCSQTRESIIRTAISQYVPELHEIMDKTKISDELLCTESGETDQYGEPIMTTEIVPITRIPLAIEKSIIEKKAIFAYGGGVLLEPTNPDSKLFKRVEDNFYDSKLDLISKKVLTECMASTQAAVIFYSPTADSVDQFRFRYKVVSPLSGDTLHPFFSEDTDDLIAFGREYKRRDKVRYDLYVKNEAGFVEIRRYENGKPLFKSGIVSMPDAKGNIVEVEGQVADVTVTPYTKLPVIYMELPQGECHDIAELRKSYEIAYSGFWDQNDRTGDPILFGKGDTLSLPAKNKRGKYIEGSADSDLKFLSPENATESRELQFRMAENYLYSLCNSVKFDLDTFKGAGVTSGEAIDKLLTPMFLDAKEKQDGILGMFYQRLINWLLHETRELFGGENDLRIYVKFKPMSFKSDADQIELVMKANGGKPVVSHLESIVMAGLSTDAQKTLDEINKTTDTVDNGVTGAV